MLERAQWVVAVVVRIKDTAAHDGVEAPQRCDEPDVDLLALIGERFVA